MAMRALSKVQGDAIVAGLWKVAGRAFFGWLAVNPQCGAASRNRSHNRRRCDRWLAAEHLRCRVRCCRGPFPEGSGAGQSGGRAPQLYLLRPQRVLGCQTRPCLLQHGVTLLFGSRAERLDLLQICFVHLHAGAGGELLSSRTPSRWQVSGNVFTIIDRPST